MSPTTTRAEREPVRTTLPKATRFEDLLSTRRGRCTATALLRAARATLLPAAFAISWLAPAPRRARVPRFAGHSSAAAGCACRHETRSLAWRHHSRRTPAELPLGRVAGATPRIALCRPIRARFDWRLTLLLACDCEHLAEEDGGVDAFVARYWPGGRLSRVCRRERSSAGCPGGAAQEICVQSDCFGAGCDAELVA